MQRQRSGGDAGPVERRRVICGVVGGRDEVQVMAVGGQWWRRWQQLTAAGPIDPLAAVYSDGGLLVVARPSNWVRVRAGLEGVQRRDGTAPMNVAAGPGELQRRWAAAAAADVSVAVLGTRHQRSAPTSAQTGVKVPPGRVSQPPGTAWKPRDRASEPWTGVKVPPGRVSQPPGTAWKPRDGVSEPWTGVKVPPGRV